MDLYGTSPQNLLITRPVLAAGTTSTVSTTAAITGYVNGVSYNSAALTNAATPTTDLNTGLAFPPISANQGTIVVLGINSAGALKAVQGGIAALDNAGNFINAPQPPAMPDGFLSFGYIVVKGGATLVGTWTFGSNNLSGVTGVVYSFKDLAGIAGRPVVA
jgi:hypothetical protein